MIGPDCIEVGYSANVVFLSSENGGRKPTQAMLWKKGGLVDAVKWVLLKMILQQRCQTTSDSQKLSLPTLIFCHNEAQGALAHTPSWGAAKARLGLGAEMRGSEQYENLTLPANLQWKARRHGWRCQRVVTFLVFLDSLSIHEKCQLLAKLGAFRIFLQHWNGQPEQPEQSGQQTNHCLTNVFTMPFTKKILTHHWDGHLSHQDPSRFWF